MGITDRITGRAKQAAGDLTGNDDLRREGAQEERKADADQERVREEMRAERERDRADRASSRFERRAERAEARADEHAREARRLDKATDADAIAEDATRDELYEEAQARDIPGRSDMNKDELAEALKSER